MRLKTKPKFKFKKKLKVNKKNIENSKNIYKKKIKEEKDKNQRSWQKQLKLEIAQNLLKIKLKLKKNYRISIYWKPFKKHKILLKYPRQVIKNTIRIMN